MTQLAQDTFIRPDQAGFGTASDGKAWSTLFGTPALAISGNEGTCSTGSDSVEQIGSGTASAINMLVRLQITGQNAGHAWRIQDANNFYRCVQDAGGTLYLQKRVGGSFSTITTASPSSFSTGVFFWLRVIHDGSNNVTVTWWLDGNTEGAPLISTSDSTFTSGNYGIACVSGGSNVNSFDHLTITDNSSGGSATKSLPVRTIVATRVTKSLPVRVLVRTQQAKSLPIRAVIRTQKTISVPVRAIVRTLHTLSLPVRAIIRTQTTKSLPIRTVIRTIKTVSFPIRSVVGTRITKSLPVRTIARTLRTLSMPVRSVVRTLATKSLPVRTGIRTQRTLSFQIRSVVRGRTLSLQIRTVVSSPPSVIPAMHIAWITDDMTMTWTTDTMIIDWRTED